MLIHAINDLQERIRATASMIVDSYPEDPEDLKQELYALVSAVNVLEIYEYGKHRTKYGDYVAK